MWIPYIGDVGEGLKNENGFLALNTRILRSEPDVCRGKNQALEICMSFFCAEITAENRFVFEMRYLFTFTVEATVRYIIE